MAKPTKKAKKRKTKKTVETTPQLGLRVIYGGNSIVTREANPDDEWSKDDTSTTWGVDRLVLSNNYPDVTACFPVKTGDDVYLVYAVYSTGDSFSHSEDGSINFIDVFKTRKKAQKAAQDIRGHANWYRDMNERWSPLTAKERKVAEKLYENSYHVDVVREDGTQLNVYTGWNGYFESLSYVEVVGLTVGAEKPSRY